MYNILLDAVSLDIQRPGPSVSYIHYYKKSPRRFILSDADERASKTVTMSSYSLLETILCGSPGHAHDVDPKSDARVLILWRLQLLPVPFPYVP